VELYKKHTCDEDMQAKCVDIIAKYLRTDSLQEVNVDGPHKSELEDTVSKQIPPWGDKQRKIFDSMQKVVLELMSSSSLPSFLVSNEYRKYANGSLKAASGRSFIIKQTIVRSRSQSIEMIERYFDLLDVAERVSVTISPRVLGARNNTTSIISLIRKSSCGKFLHPDHPDGSSSASPLRLITETSHKIMAPPRKPLPPRPPAPAPPPKPSKNCKLPSVRVSCNDLLVVRNDDARAEENGHNTMSFSLLGEEFLRGLILDEKGISPFEKDVDEVGLLPDGEKILEELDIELMASFIQSPPSTESFFGRSTTPFPERSTVEITHQKIRHPSI